MVQEVLSASKDLVKCFDGDAFKNGFVYHAVGTVYLCGCRFQEDGSLEFLNYRKILNVVFLDLISKLSEYVVK